MALMVALVTPGPLPPLDSKLISGFGPVFPFDWPWHKPTPDWTISRQMRHFLCFGECINSSHQQIRFQIPNGAPLEEKWMLVYRSFKTGFMTCVVLDASMSWKKTLKMSGKFEEKEQMFCFRSKRGAHRKTLIHHQPFFSGGLTEFRHTKKILPSADCYCSTGLRDHWPLIWKHYTGSSWKSFPPFQGLRETTSEVAKSENKNRFFHSLDKKLWQASNHCFKIEASNSSFWFIRAEVRNRL